MTEFNIAQSLDRIVSVARHHPFYRDRFEGVARFEDCPLLEKLVLYQRVQESMRDTAFRHGTYFSPTGGTTTGSSLYFPTAIAENKRQRVLLAERLANAGMIQPTSIVLNMFPCTRLVRSLEIFNEYCELCGATVLSVGAHETDEEAWSVARQFGATLLAGMPSRLIALARWLQATGQCLPTERGLLTERGLQIEKVLIAGELLHPPKRQMLERAFDVRRFCGVYGSAEMGVVAYQADLCDPPVYRFPLEILYVEIVEADGEGFGRLVATNLVGIRHPLVRYDTGDLGRVVNRTADEVWIELRGRGGDSFAIGGGYWHLADFAGVLSPFAEWQIVIDFDEKAGMDRISFSVVTDDAPAKTRQRELKMAIRAILEADDQTHLTDVAFVPAVALRRNPATLKVPSIVDLRKGGRPS
jgi:phenylacetate-coenzyme A ligase PaaK-like adenylate-forming protein